jgi:cytoskeleton protein RodZ
MTSEQNTDPICIDLKTARQNSGLTLKELFERTRISVVNLEAIENGDFHLLPVPIYARNFIKTYADALGVDSKPILQSYESYLQAIQLKEKAQKTEPPEKTSASSRTNQHKAYVWIISIVIVFVAISFIVSLYDKPDPEVAQAPGTKTEAALPDVELPIIVQPDDRPAMDLPAQHEKPSPAPEVKTTEDKAPLQPQPKPQEPQPKKVAAAAPAASTAPAQKSNAKNVQTLVDAEEASVMSIRATEETWIRIKADDKESFQVLLKPGETVSQKGARFSMDIGNAGGVKIQFNGKTFENLGKSGQVIHLRIP